MLGWLLSQAWLRKAAAILAALGAVSLWYTVKQAQARRDGAENSELEALLKDIEGEKAINDRRDRILHDDIERLREQYGHRGYPIADSRSDVPRLVRTPAIPPR